MTKPIMLKQWQALKWVFEGDEPARSDPQIQCSICHKPMSEYHRILDVFLCNYCYCPT